MAEPGLFDYIKMISWTKEIPEFDAHFEKVYTPFVVNRFFSLFQGNDVIIANALNKNYGMSKTNHFLFLHGMIRKSKRFSKWPKEQKDDRVKFIMEVYNYSYKRAKEANVLLSDEDLSEIREAMKKGGKM